VMLLLFMATLELIFGMALADPEHRKTEWIEPLFIYCTVGIIVNVASTLDWKRERMYERLSKKLATSNTRFVVRGGKQLEIEDSEICVGDVLSFNAHMAATISCDGILISGEGVTTDESALTGEPEPIVKSREKPFMVSGTTSMRDRARCLSLLWARIRLRARSKRQYMATMKMKCHPSSRSSTLWQNVSGILECSSHRFASSLK